MHKANLRRRRARGAIIVSICVIFLLSLAIAEQNFVFSTIHLGTTLVVVLAIHRVFPGSLFFTISLANCLAIYACIFVFFVENNFARTDLWLVHACFGLPPLAFMVGAIIRRAYVRRIVQTHHARTGRYFSKIFLWLLPMIVIGCAAFAVPRIDLDPPSEGMVFAAMMGLIALIVIFVSANIASFLVDTGLLFEAFFDRIARLAVPAFAFLTFYSLTIIVFASIYRMIDRFTQYPQFQIDAVARDISFSESLYFSVITLSTVGYGDIVPITGLVRVIVSLQVVAGVLLLLFGFNEILNYARNKHEKSDG